MSLGRRQDEQKPIWVATQELPRSAGHPFYARLEGLLREAEFDRQVEDLCAPHYKDGGRPSIPPGVYFRMLFVGYFEGIDSQRGIAWRCSDSIALREFLGVPITRSTPDHSSLTVIRQRLPLAVHEAVFTLVLGLAAEKGLLKGKSLAVDATMLEANAAMKSIVRRDTGEDWKAYLRRLAAEEGEESTKDDDLRRFDKRRKKKKVSNDDWGSPSDPDSKIARMKDGTTHLAYKAEHAVDLDSDLVVSASLYHATQADSATLLPTIDNARTQLAAAGGSEPKEVVTDRGYHKLETLVLLEEQRLRSYVCEPRVNGERRWDDKPEEQRAAFDRNHRRVRGERSRKLQRLRSERAERSFAHVCETGGARRTWIRGLTEVAKRYLVQVAGVTEPPRHGLVRHSGAGASRRLSPSLPFPAHRYRREGKAGAPPQAPGFARHGDGGRKGGAPGGTPPGAPLRLRRTVDLAIPRRVASPQSPTPFRQACLARLLSSPGARGGPDRPARARAALARAARRGPAAGRAGSLV